MSIKKAQEYIKHIENTEKVIFSEWDFERFVYDALKKGFEFSEEEFLKAHRINVQLKLLGNFVG